LNAEPLTIRELRGSVVLVEFWDYANTASARTLPYLHEWYTRYRDFDLRVIGVHTPQFKFGRNPENVEAAIRKAHVDFPVVTDNDGIIWTAYSSRMWPTRFLVDRLQFLSGLYSSEPPFPTAIGSVIAMAAIKGQWSQPLQT
jgi:peroxiredoxin